jgi:hypothetical protein
VTFGYNIVVGPIRVGVVEIWLNEDVFADVAHDTVDRRVHSECFADDRV